jgi:hypothetical protein
VQILTQQTHRPPKPTARSQGSCRLDWQAENRMMQGAVWATTVKQKRCSESFKQDDAPDGGTRKGFGQRAVERWSEWRSLRYRGG